MVERARHIEVLGLNWADNTGGRFNGFSNIALLQEEGIRYRMLVGTKKTTDSLNTAYIYPFRLIRFANRVMNKIEYFSGFQSFFRFSTFFLLLHPWFWRADLIHLHIIHKNWFRLESIKWISRMKKVVWTIHDPWIVTGHCIHPSGCSRWDKKCGKCPNLAAEIPVNRDRTFAERRRKNRLLEDFQGEILVSSNWMKDLLERATFPKLLRNIHKISFGVDHTIFRFSQEGRETLRTELSINEGSFVILVRGALETYKGFVDSLDILKQAIKLNRNIVIFVVGNQVNINADEFDGRCFIFPWIDDDAELVKLYSAADIFLSTSTDESFGLMCIEAMSMSLPVIYREGTAPHEFLASTFPFRYTSSSGINGMLKAILQTASLTKLERQRVGSQNRAIAIKSFTLKQHVMNLSSMYKDIVFKQDGP